MKKFAVIFLCIFVCESFIGANASEKSKEQCEESNSELRYRGAIEQGLDSAGDVIETSKDNKVFGAVVGAAMGAAIGYVAGWWNGEDCSKYSSQKYNGSSSLNATVDSEAYINIAKEHFSADSVCNVDKTISFYGNSVSYDGKNIDKNKLIKIKEDACTRFSGGVSLNIKNDHIGVLDFDKDPNIKLAVYDVDFKFYSEKKQKNITGTTRVIIAITVDSKKIVGELHKKLG